ncbi:PD-(D/E)XK nuclease family protein [Streptomyces sp. MK5]|uniref:RecB family exonuclease n=1 Tax=Streptomyces sp. MK5 TaxID=3064253 RepID=UPI00274167D1|nr:PD-(D/E)XK nuclease family protein [Streptomyces sp. MK5]
METTTAGGTEPDGTETAPAAEGTPAPPPAPDRTPTVTADAPMPAVDGFGADGAGADGAGADGGEAANRAAGAAASTTAESGDAGVGPAAQAVAGTVSTAGPVSLSPSRAGDFMQCPLLYRFRVIDRLPEKPSEAATRGTLVHAVLERLFDAPAAERTAPRAKALIPGQWDRLRESRPELVELFADDMDGERLARWLTEAEQLVERWFTLEDPTRLEPAERELFVETELDSGLRLRGIIDRVDVAPTGEVRIVDYKTGKAPRPEYAEGALFQMKFYALVVWRLKKIVPRRLQLVYLGSGDVLTYDPVPADLERVERKLLALWEAIRLATETGDWRPRPTKLCGWCDHRAHCPEFGGTPPPYPLPLPRGRTAAQVQGRMGPE